MTTMTLKKYKIALNVMKRQKDPIFFRLFSSATLFHLVPTHVHKETSKNLYFSAFFFILLSLVVEEELKIRNWHISYLAILLILGFRCI